MKKILLLGLSVLFICQICFAQEAAPQTSPKYKEQPLTLIIKSDKKVYEVGEDIKVNFKFINQSEDTIKIKVGRQDLYNFFDFFISRNWGKPRIIGGANVEDIKEEKIAPGESYSFDGLINELDMRAMRPIFYEPGRDNTGRYKITITYRGDITITSNTITIEVKERQFKNLFEKQFYQIKNGMSREQVISQLGQPFEKRIHTLPAGPFWGPQEGLASILKPGAKFEEWGYQKDGTTYLIWFGSLEVKPEAEWKVIGKTLFPTGAVF
ncbi:MAG: hypothetical protein V1674_00230 [Candidatus Omnitrophota bacterium]